MKPRDVMPFGEHRFVLHFFEQIPDQIRFGHFYLAKCGIAFPDGAITHAECIAHWPTNRRNVVGQSLGNWLLVLIVIDILGDRLYRSEINVLDYGAAISEGSAWDWWGEGSA